MLADELVAALGRIAPRQPERHDLGDRAERERRGEDALPGDRFSRRGIRIPDEDAAGTGP